MREVESVVDDLRTAGDEEELRTWLEELHEGFKESTEAAIEAIDPGLESAASTLGANRFLVFLSITLPLMLPGILAGAVLAFARALGEFGATITFVGNIPGLTQTIPTAIYTYTQVPGGEATAAKLSAVSFTLAVAGLLLSELIARRMHRLLDM